MSQPQWQPPASGSAQPAPYPNYQDPTGYWGPEGQAWVLRLDAELSNGQKLTAEGVTWYYQDGNLANAVG